MSLLLTPTTAVAQQDSTRPSIDSVSAYDDQGNGLVTIIFARNVSTVVESSYSVTFDGVPQTIISVGHVPGDSRSVAIRLASLIPDGAVVVVAYNKHPSAVQRLYYTGTSEEVDSFRWKVGTGHVPTEMEIYDALGEYFSGTATVSGEGTLDLVNRLIGDVYGDDVTYHEKLLEKVDAGALNDIVPRGQSAWGDPGTEDWAQMGQGFPKCIYDAQGNCIDMSETWGEQYKCGNKPQPGLADNDFGDFFWACNDGQWVPVRRPRPGVDYAHDHQLIRPGQDGYNEKCRYVRHQVDAHGEWVRDENGDLVPVLDENGQVIPEPVSRYNGDGTWTTTHGANYDPIDGSCRGRG